MRVDWKRERPDGDGRLPCARTRQGWRPLYHQLRKPPGFLHVRPAQLSQRSHRDLLRGRQPVLQLHHPIDLRAHRCSGRKLRRRSKLLRRQRRLRQYDLEMRGQGHARAIVFARRGVPVSEHTRVHLGRQVRRARLCLRWHVRRSSGLPVLAAGDEPRFRGGRGSIDAWLSKGYFWSEQPVALRTPLQGRCKVTWFDRTTPLQTEGSLRICRVLSSRHWARSLCQVTRAW